jgi:hypothetical protein
MIKTGNAVSGRIIGSGPDSPQGVVSAVRGQLYLRINGSADATLYVKESGDFTTAGWSVMPGKVTTQRSAFIPASDFIASMGSPAYSNADLGYYKHTPSWHITYDDSVSCIFAANKNTDMALPVTLKVYFTSSETPGARAVLARIGQYGDNEQINGGDWGPFTLKTVFTTNILNLYIAEITVTPYQQGGSAFADDGWIIQIGLSGTPSIDLLGICVENYLVNPPLDAPDVLASSGKACIYRSIDGGENWTLKSPVPDMASIVDCENGVMVAISDNGSITSALYRSTDRGGLWTSLGFQINPYGGISGKLIYKNGAILFPVYVAGYAEFRIYRSVDFGNTWAVAGTVSAPDAYYAAYPGKIIDFGSNELLAIAGRVTVRSLDGGVTWLPAALIPEVPIPPGHTAIHSVFADCGNIGNNVIMAMDSYIDNMPAGPMACVIVSSDKGATWSGGALAGQEGKRSSTILYFSSGNALMGFSTNTIPMVSTDGGLTWINQGVTPIPMIALSGLLIDPLTAYIGSATDILKTIDGGITFVSKLVTPSTVTQIIKSIIP